MRIAQVQNMSRYNRWMNQRLYAVCATMSDSARREDRKVFFGSIHGTLNHLLLADKIWLGRFRSETFVIASLAQELYTDFESLRSEREATDQIIEEWGASLTDDILTSRLTYTSIVNPAPRSCEMSLAVMHFFNHQTHHRGQLTALLSQCGRDYGITDLIWLPEVLERNAK